MEGALSRSAPGKVRSPEDLDGDPSRHERSFREVRDPEAADALMNRENLETVLGRQRRRSSGHARCHRLMEAGRPGVYHDGVMSTSFHLPGRVGRNVATLILFGLLVAACAPTATVSREVSPVAAAVARTAEIAFHRMEIGKLQTGSYTTNVLVDLDLSSGTRWTLLDYPADGSSYTLQFTSDQVPGAAWRVSPRGVVRATLP